MPLWTDRPFVTATDLRTIDAEALNIARNEKIELGGPGGLLQQAIQECAIEIQSLMQSPGLLMTPSGIPSVHMTALLGPIDAQTVRVHMSQIVVSNTQPNLWTPLKSWVTRKALLKLYAEASERQSGDRYQEKWKRLNLEITNRHEGYMINTGIPAVQYPIACPAAQGEKQTGTWGSGNLSAIPGSYTGGRLRVAVSYTSAKYRSQKDLFNGESALSVPALITLQPAQGVQVDITSLTPLVRQDHGQRYLGFYFPQTVTGWNVWVGDGEPGSTLYLQTDPERPIEIAQKQYQVTAPILVGGMWPEHEGQWPESSLSVQRLLFRG